jgi:hypothetical protein
MANKLSYDETQFLFRALHNLRSIRGGMGPAHVPQDRLLDLCTLSIEQGELWLDEYLKREGTWMEAPEKEEAADVSSGA